jgi:hypothetical protein
MNATRNNKHRRNSTRFSKDGCTVFVVLRVDRRNYEFARAWAAFHADADPTGTAEDQLEGYLNMALMTHMDETDWKGPPEIEALYRRSSDYENSGDEVDDGIPF